MISFPKKYFLVNYQLALIIITGVIIRLIALNKEVFFDEALSLYIAQQPLHKIIYFHLKGIDLTFPLFNYILSFWLKVSPLLIWARGFTLILGVLVIYMTYKVGRLLFNNKIALLTAFFISCSEPFIYHSVQARQYSLLVLFALLSEYYFLKFLKEPVFRNQLFYITFSVLCIYCHIFGIFVLLTQTAVFILNSKKFMALIKQWILSLVYIALLTFPLSFYYINQYKVLYKLGNYIGPPSIRNMLDIIIGYANHKYFLAFYIILGILIIGNKYEELDIRRSPYQKIKIIFLKAYSNFSLQLAIVSLFLPIVMVMIVSSGKITIAGGGYFIPFFIFFYFLISKTITSYKREIQKLIIIVTVAGLFLNGLRYSVLIGYIKPKLEPEKVVELLRAESRKGDLIAIDNVFFGLPIVAYLNIPLKVLTNQKTVDDAKVYKSDFITNNFFVLEDIPITENSSLKQYKRLWIISLDNKDLSAIDWFIKSNSEHLVKIIKDNGYVVRLYSII